MIKILGIPIFDLGFERAVHEIISNSSSLTNSTLLVSATGAHGIIEASESKDFYTLLNSFDINLPDGMPTVWVGKWKGANKIERCYGPSIFEAIIKSSATEPIHHFLCGGKPGVAEALKSVCANKFLNNKVVGTWCPPFRELNKEEWGDLANQIERHKSKIVWIGLSTPKQEKFAKVLSNYVKGVTIITVGAAFDFHTGNSKQAPKWMQQIGLEWLFRLLNEPKRLYKRYLKIVPLFIWLNLKEFVHFYILKKA
jgi:N-acetylglucosaminyldiphosphoundecaprenol N-acetyl-beta-D-mannosaminyltransferase